jgi:hypothetical protein
MIDLDLLITGGVGIVTTIVSGCTSWFFARTTPCLSETAPDTATGLPKSDSSKRHSTLA